MNKLKFSIITVCYNSASTIERTIKSVLTQSCKDYEYIIVDGASKDETLNIVRMYEPAFEGRMKWKSEPDKGIYDAMNKGIKMSSGEVIGIVNSDDWLEKDALQIVYDSIAENAFSMNNIYTGGIMYHGKNKNVVMMPNLQKMKRKSKMYYMGGIRHPATFVPKKVYETFGLYNAKMKLSADTDFILRCYFGKVIFIPINSILSNMSEGGLSTTPSIKTIKIGYIDYKTRLIDYKVSPFSRKYLQWCYMLIGYYKILRGIFVK